ncbi:MAG: hypothetical protein IH994_03405 [Proteobacteria bacterium]|nr:hypothetical protein [Pseudomonadota bacterium]
MPENTMPITGGCLCGAVRFQAKAPFDSARAYHCSQCRKQFGRYMVGARVSDWRDVEIAVAESVNWYRASDAARRRTVFEKLAEMALSPEQAAQAMEAAE